MSAALKAAQAAVRVERTRDRIMGRLTKGPTAANSFTAAEKAQLPQLERLGAIVYDGAVWKLARLEDFRARFEAQLANAGTGGDPALSRLAAGLAAQHAVEREAPAADRTPADVVLRLSPFEVKAVRVALEASRVDATPSVRRNIDRVLSVLP